MTARHVDAPLPESRPRYGQHYTPPPRQYPANPDTCPHPIEARVTPIGQIVTEGDRAWRNPGPHGAVAKCHDCGLYLVRGEWVW